MKNEVTGDVKVNSRTVTLYAGWIGSSVPDSLNGEDHFAYVQGYADGTVRPNTPVTRAQVATILFRLLDESVRKEYLTENNTFTDVASNYWANTAISTRAGRLTASIPTHPSPGASSRLCAPGSTTAR